MATPPLNIPMPVIDWVRDVFMQVNARSAATLSRIPNTFETTLDHSLIGHLAEFAAPFRFPSDWVVTLDTHFLGGRYWGHWEIADIGILVIFRRKATILATKIALLQSKRLYPDEIENAVDMHPIEYLFGFGRLLKSDSEYRSHIKPRTFHFSPESKYRALLYKDEQYKEILKYSQSVPVHYLLYNPADIPHSAELPASAASVTIPNLKVGCRVVKAEYLDSKLSAVKLRKSSSPTFQEVGGKPLDPKFWTLHNFVADLVLGCQEGHLARHQPV